MTALLFLEQDSFGGEPAVHRGAVRKQDRTCSTKCICGSEKVAGSRETFASETVVAADTRVAPSHAVPGPAARREKESSAICEEGVRYVKKECPPLIFCTPLTSIVWANDRVMPERDGDVGALALRLAGFGFALRSFLMACSA